MKSAVAVLVVALLFGAHPASGTEKRTAPTTTIKVDQVGYSLTGTKIALLVTTTPSTTFSVRRTEDDEEVFRGKSGAAILDPDTRDHVQELDFSALMTPGQVLAGSGSVSPGGTAGTTMI